MYAFKKGYKYTITVNATTDGPITSYPYLRLDLSNTTVDASACTGPENITQNTSGPFYGINSSSYIDYSYPFNTSATYSQNWSYLNVTSLPVSGVNSVGVRIRKITIVESLVPPSFTLTASTSTFVCGKTGSTTLTVTNHTSTPSVTNYKWDLGFAPNGWYYNAAPAAGTINTSTPTLNLTKDCNTSQKSVSVTVTALGSNYNTNAASFSLTSPAYSLTGPQGVCSGSATYSVLDLPCRSTVAWSSNNTSVATVTASNNVATVSKVGNGSARITANITTSCTAGIVTRYIDIVTSTPATPTITYTKNGGSQTDYIFTATSSGNYNGFDWYVDAIKIRSNADAVTYYSIPCNVQRTIKASQTNGCGTSAQGSVFVWNTPCSPSFTVSPNPTDDRMTVEPSSDTTTAFSMRSKDEKASPNVIKLTLFDKNGNIKRQWKYSDVKMGKIQESIAGLPYGIYVLEITFNGQKEIHQVIKR